MQNQVAKLAKLADKREILEAPEQEQPTALEVAEAVLCLALACAVGYLILILGARAGL